MEDIFNLELSLDESMEVNIKKMVLEEKKRFFHSVKSRAAKIVKESIKIGEATVDVQTT